MVLHRDAALEAEGRSIASNWLDCFRPFPLQPDPASFGRRHDPACLRTIALVLAICCMGAVEPAGAATAAPGLSRTVEVKTKYTRPMRGMTASGRVRIIGTVRTDSYDSGDPSKSTGGSYDATKVGEQAFIGTTSKTPNNFEITGNAQVVGQVGTGAPGVLTIGGSAAVGSKAFVNAGKSGLESSGYLQDDFNVTFPNAELPFNPATAPAPTFSLLGTLLNGVSYHYTIGDGNYALTNFKLGSGQKAVITGKTVLYVADTFEMTSDASITILPGASLDLYVGKTTTLTGGSIANMNGKAEFLNYYGLPGNTSFYLRGNSAFIGNIYAPSAKIDFAGTSDFFGASVSKEIDVTGAFQFHYDEALARKGLTYVPISWKEL